MDTFKSNETFYEEFLIPLMDKCFKHLKLGGAMCFNISPKMFDELMKKGYQHPDDQIKLKQQLGQYHKKHLIEG